MDSIGFEYFAVVAHIQYPWAQLVDHHHNHKSSLPTSMGSTSSTRKGGDRLSRLFGSKLLSWVRRVDFAFILKGNNIVWEWSLKPLKLITCNIFACIKVFIFVC